MFTTRHLLSFFVPAFVLLQTGCSPRAVREAQEVVAEADRLHIEGQAFTDSVAIAEAYNTLEKWQYVYPTDYAHACYHYGRLLRNNDDPVAAMQVFINATHSNTRDYHILGRNYSNMGSICHLAGEYQLSYDMYSSSADMFLQNGDTLLYYYGLNSMAFETAELEKKEVTLNILTEIRKECTDKYALSKTWETEADAYLRVHHYDSALYCAQQSIILGNTEPTCLIIKAQAYSKIGIKDSALYYANLILEYPSASYQNIFNALYIVSNLDSTLCSDDVRVFNSKREDIRYYV